jgi:hypothetical protein
MKDMSMQNHDFVLSVFKPVLRISLFFVVRAPVYTGAFNYLVRRADFLVVQHVFVFIQ